MGVKRASRERERACNVQERERGTEHLRECWEHERKGKRERGRERKKEKELLLGKYMEQGI